MEIKSILDTDLYKFSVSYAYMRLFPDAVGTFEFVDRNKSHYTEDDLDYICYELANLSTLKLSDNEKRFMQDRCYFIPDYYFEWLQSFEFDCRNLSISLDEENHLHIRVTDYLYKVTLWEIPILAIVSRTQHREDKWNIDDLYTRTSNKVHNLPYEFKVADFGTRRRFNFEVQLEVIEKLLHDCPQNFVGTSNCYIAYLRDIKMIGTFPHEWVMFHGAMYGYDQANYLALENWVNVYDGELGIALSDTYTSDVFFRNFSKKHARLFDGVRQDSGDPFQFINKCIDRYRELNVDPLTKTIVFSDSLDFKKAVDIFNCCKGRIKCSFGIGTNLTCDLEGVKPSNIVMKLVSCQMNSKQPVKKCIKLSDVEGKHIGDPEEVALAQMIISQHYDE